MAKKYDLSFRDVDYVVHRLEIYDDSYGGAALDVEGKFSISASCENVFDVIQPMTMRVEMEASNAQDLSDLGLASERQFRCVYTRDNFIKFQGWLNPDGWWEDMTTDNWMVSFDVIDGLGYLDGLAYVQSSGLPFAGKQTALDIVVNSLARTGLTMDIYTNIHIMYTGYVTNADILNAATFNSERFIQDEEEYMSCLDVLKSTLEIFGACIRQREGAWYIFRPNTLAASQSSNYFRYDSDGTYIGVVAVDVSESAGSVGTGTFDLQYVEGDQRLSTIRALGAYSVNYKYGTASALNANSLLYNSDGTDTGWSGWTVVDSTDISSAGAGTYGVRHVIVAAGTSRLGFQNAGTINVSAGDILEATFSADSFTYPLSNTVTIYYEVKVTVGIPAVTYYLNPGGGWGTGVFQLSKTYVGQTNGTQTIVTAPVPGTGIATVVLSIYSAESPIPGAGQLVVQEFKIALTDEAKLAEEGEIHTASRDAATSSKTEDPAEVFLGDTPLDTYVGAIYKIDGITNTEEWTRYTLGETKPLLQIMVEERLRATASTRYKFSGSIRGYFEYFSVFTLEGVDGFFMPVEYNYNAEKNVTNVIMEQIIAADPADITYRKTIEYGDTIKPKIEG
jgi:hypothetical protein